MAIQLHNANIRPVAQTGAVRANPAALSDTGEKEAWGGVANAGNALFEFGKQLNEAAAFAQLSTAERKRDERILKAYTEIEAEPDYDKHQLIYSKAVAELNKFYPKNPTAARYYKSSLNKRLPEFEYSFNSIHNKLKRQSIETEFNLNWDAAISSAIIADDKLNRASALEKVENLAADMAIKGIKQKDKVAQLVQSGKYEIKKNWLKNDALKKPYQEALSYVSDMNNQPEITEDDRKEIIDDLMFRNDRKLAVEKVSLDRKIESERLEIVNRLADGTLDWQFIATTSLDAAEKNQWREKAEARIKALKDGDEDPLNQSDSKVILDISKRINLDMPITKNELAAKVGNGLSIKDFENYSKDIDERNKDVSTNIIIKKGVQTLADIFERGRSWGKYEDSVAHIQLYAKRVKQWTDFWRKKPNATTAEGKELMSLLTEDVYNNWINKYDIYRMSEIDQQIFDLMGADPLSGSGKIDSFLLDASKDIDVFVEPSSVTEFEANVMAIGDDEQAKKYYDKWVNKFEK